MTWTPPDGTNPGARPPKPTGPAALSWRLGHSAWVLFPVLGFGCLGGLGFLYVGVRARRPSWWLPGVVYTVIGWAGILVGSRFGKDTAGQDIFFTCWLMAWLVSIGHALIINSAWLRWRAGYQPWYAQPAQTAWVGPQPVHQQPAPPSLQNVIPPQQQYYSAYQPPVPAPDPYQPPVQVDVNTATEQQFATLLGPERAARVLLVRQSRGGFAGVNDFTAAAGLAPHEFVALRDRLVCTPPAPPDDTVTGPYGRIVDV
ncbi:ComEA family DNA-binding protein [Actinoplanes regularis]|uniref:ComEA family DNA-binding protein n=1 Tax=Actinoplanes regularis TaxID=52697 RepID=UPI0024A260C7|nr:helix-hairpin-helix domain-containing protein [Actinoplanes regularis]GLW28501.1 hypothetical protein Areg01_14410 [Actinoplanes regularis]